MSGEKGALDELYYNPPTNGLKLRPLDNNFCNFNCSALEAGYTIWPSGRTTRRAIRVDHRGFSGSIIELLS